MSARNWRDVRSEALKEGRITEAGVADARRRLDGDMTRWIREYYADGEPDEKIAEEMGVSAERVREALDGEGTG